MLSRLVVCVLFVPLALALGACGTGGTEGSGVSETGAEVKPLTTAPPVVVPEAPTPASGGAPWPAPANTLELVVQAGLEPLRQELLSYHVHSHLDVFVNGQAVVVPAGIGINVDDPGLVRGEACERPCISSLHTHDTTGILHIESAERRPFTLGQFFTEWAVRLDSSCVGGYCRPEATISVYVDGQPYDGDPAGIRLDDRQEIAVVIGTPPTEIPASYEGFEPVT